MVCNVWTFLFFRFLGRWSSEERANWQVHTLEGHSDEVCWVAFSPDGKRVVSRSIDNYVRVWNAVSGDTVSVFRERVFH